MANKRIKDLESATITLTHKMVVDKTGLSEAEQLTIDALLTFVEAEYIYANTFDVTDTDGSPNWDVSFNHALASVYPTVVLWDGNGYQKSGVGIASITDNNNVKCRMHVAIAGTWKIKISKF